MTLANARWIGRSALIGLLALGGCVDMFTTGSNVPAPHWSGTTTAGPETIAECAPMAIEVEIRDEALYLSSVVDGRAFPQATGPASLGTRAADAVTSWWVEGYMNPDFFVQMETRRQQPVYFRARPYAVWRGTMVEPDKIVMVESGSPCHRSLVLTRS